MSNRPSIFAELQRRHVYKVGAAYCVAGWLLVQIVTQVFPIYDISTGVQRVFVGAIIAGFPLALVLAWIFDITPQGIVRTDAAPTAETPALATQRRGAARRLNYLLGGLLLLALGYMSMDRFIAARANRGVVVTVTANDDKSIAVLPFENLSDDKANAYFALGMQDEILTRLAKIGALKVISRTSTAHYASSPDNLPEIAKQLGVANILEGSVQKAGDAVHVNVQLIRAATDDHLWAESYDRKLDNIFGVEGEVASAIAEQLNTTLSSAEQRALAQKATNNPRAYDTYLRALATVEVAQTMDDFRKTIELLQEAVRLDPNFAEAWAQLSITQSFGYVNGVDPQSITPEAIKLAADTASRLQPDLTHARLAQACYRYRLLRDYAGAEAELQAALENAPNDGGVLQMLGWVERRDGRYDSALQHLEKAAQVDPHDAFLLQSIGGETLAMLGRWDEDRVWLDRALAIEPHLWIALAYKTYSYQAEGRLGDAAALLAAFPLENEDAIIANQRVYQRLLERHYDEAIAEVQADIKRPDTALDGWGPSLRAWMGLAQLRSGRTAEASASFQSIIDAMGPADAERPDDSMPTVALSYAYAGTGRIDKALAQAKRGVDIYRRDMLHAAQAMEVLAQMQYLAGDKDTAIATLTASRALPNGNTLAELRLSPLWDPMRNDARFQKLLAGAAQAPTT